jgi:hypothetical protein
MLSLIVGVIVVGIIIRLSRAFNLRGVFLSLPSFLLSPSLDTRGERAMERSSDFPAREKFIFVDFTRARRVAGFNVRSGDLRIIRG